MESEIRKAQAVGKCFLLRDTLILPKHFILNNLNNVSSNLQNYSSFSFRSNAIRDESNGLR